MIKYEFKQIGSKDETLLLFSYTIISKEVEGVKILHFENKR